MLKLKLKLPDSGSWTFGLSSWASMPESGTMKSFPKAEKSFFLFDDKFSILPIVSRKITGTFKIGEC